jgi:hypothetical protein
LIHHFDRFALQSINDVNGAIWDDELLADFVLDPHKALNIAHYTSTVVLPVPLADKPQTLLKVAKQMSFAQSDECRTQSRSAWHRR